MRVLTKCGHSMGTPLSDYNFAHLDEQTKRMTRRAILKWLAVPGYQVDFASREMPTQGKVLARMLRFSPSHVQPLQLAVLLVS